MDEENRFFSVPAGPEGSRNQLTSLQKAELIRGVGIFSHAVVEELFRLASIAREVQFAAGEIVARENDIIDALYVVIVGSVEMASANDTFRQIVGPRETLGLHSVLTREPLEFTATALKETVALSIGAEDLYNLLSNDPEIMVSIFRHFTEKSGLARRS